MENYIAVMAEEQEQKYSKILIKRHQDVNTTLNNLVSRLNIAVERITGDSFTPNGESSIIEVPQPFYGTSDSLFDKTFIALMELEEIAKSLSKFA